MRKDPPFLIFPFLYNLSQKYLACLSALFFPIDGRILKNYYSYCSSLHFNKKTDKNNNKKTKKQKEKLKRYNLMIEILLPNNTSNCFNFFLTENRGKNLWPTFQKWKEDSYLQENQRMYTTCSCNLCQVRLKSVLFTGDCKGPKDATSEINIYYLRNPIKPPMVY